MTLYQFRLLTPRVQMQWVLACSTYLAQRWEEAAGGVNLYHLLDVGRSFFAEVGVDDAQKCFVVLRSFSNTVPLGNYAHGLQLPEL